MTQRIKLGSRLSDNVYRKGKIFLLWESVTHQVEHHLKASIRISLQDTLQLSLERSFIDSILGVTHNQEFIPWA